MPPRIYDTGRRPEYLDQEESPEYREAQLEKRLNSISKLGQAFQNYFTNRRDRKLLDELGAMDVGQRSGGVGQLAQAQSQAGIDIPQDPGGGVNFIDPAQQLQRPNIGKSPGVVQAPQRQGILQRFQRSFESAMPLSGLEKAMAESQIQTLLQQAQARYYNQRGLGRTNERAPRGLDEINEVMAMTELDPSDAPEQIAYKREPRKSAMNELRRYQSGSIGSSSGDLQDLIDEYQNTNDPAKAAELEELLSQQGVQFQ